MKNEKYPERCRVDFFLKQNMHEKNIPGDEMETYVEKIGCSVTHFPYCL